MNKRVKFTITSLWHTPWSVQAYRHKHVLEDSYSIAWMISWQHLKILSSLLQVSRSKEDMVVLSPAGNLLYHTFLCTYTLPHFLTFQWKIAYRIIMSVCVFTPLSTVVTAYSIIRKWRTKFCTRNVQSLCCGSWSFMTAHIYVHSPLYWCRVILHGTHKNTYTVVILRIYHSIFSWRDFTIAQEVLTQKISISPLQHNYFKIILRNTVHRCSNGLLPLAVHRCMQLLELILPEDG
jgi:hypothetical protein